MKRLNCRLSHSLNITQSNSDDEFVQMEKWDAMRDDYRISK